MNTFNRSMFAGAQLAFTPDFSAVSVDEWAPNSYIEASALVRPTDPNQTGFVFQNGSTAGQTGPLEPNWPNIAGQTVTDGSVTWTALIPVVAGQDTIASVTWVQISPPDGLLTISNKSNDSMTATASLGGGTKGNVYTVECQATMTSGNVNIAQIILTVN